MPNSDLQENVVAVYRYEKTSNEDLQFEKGEHLAILRRLTDGNWALARNGKGQTGLIPLNFVESDVDPPWLHGQISREEAESLLQDEPPGSFLVRASSRFVGDYTLSLVGGHSSEDNSYATKVSPTQHYHIYSVNGLDSSVSSEFFSLDNKEMFPSLRKLVEHYKVVDRGLAHPLTAPVVDMERVCMQRLRDRHWIPREHLTLGQKLGHGEFGEVLKAKIGDREVAVKRYKASAKRQLIYEACIMSELKHENLLELLGVTEEPDEDGTVVADGAPCTTFCLVTEFSPLGSLLFYLRSRGRALLGPATLLSFATDVARGLVYMEARSYLHRDVAARNVLLFSSAKHPFYPVAKLGDFGLAFRLRSSSPTFDHRVTGEVDFDAVERPTCVGPLCFTGTQRMSNITRIPIKWTAPESIRTRIFTHKSDVWSFGVMLWELYSFGRLPYPRLMTSQVLAHLEAGERMEAPQDCPKGVYSLMTETFSRGFSKSPCSSMVIVVLPSDRSAENVSISPSEDDVNIILMCISFAPSHYRITASYYQSTIPHTRLLCTASM
uniref:Tyrosine-protein kinase n=1 Tax=Echinococcus granulosus TaxID=6210 RepID=A0A068WUM7_ECHGR|nr:c src tyrosine kinase [Echinococcus granulosus]